MKTRIRITITPEIYVDVEPHMYVLGHIIATKKGEKRFKAMTYHSKLEHLAESIHRLFLCENGANVNLQEAFRVMTAGIEKLNDALQREGGVTKWEE